ncbi:MAG TPA: glycosyltransferase family 2 protein, partial [Candidatus Obscuribacterales bacterium]
MHVQAPALLSIVVPLFNEESNIEALYGRLKQIEKRLQPTRTEIIFVDDCSQDRTWALVSGLCRQHENVRSIRFAKNSGSHAAIMAGLVACGGDCAMFLAGDLQDPPELIPDMLDKWRQGTGIVWAARQQVPGQKRRDSFLSFLYWRLAHYQTSGSLPKRGVDFFLIDRKVIEAIAPGRHCRAPIFQTVADTGFKSAVVYYTKAERAGGKSGWTLKKKVALVFETLLFSPLVLRAFTAGGAALAGFGILGVIGLLTLWLVTGTQLSGVALALSVLSLLTGLQMTMLGLV